MSVLILFASTLIVCFAAYQITRLYPTGGPIVTGLQTYVISLVIIVATTLICAVFDVVFWGPLLGLTLAVAGLSGGLAWRRGVFGWPRLSYDQPAVLNSLKLNWLLYLLVLAVAIGHILNFAWTIKLFPLFGDAEAYHLPRAYFWERLGSLDIFSTGDTRQTESPLNANIMLLWTFIFGRNYGLSFLPQFLAGVALFFGAFKVARFAQASTAQSLLIACILSCLPQFVLQVINASNDITVAALAMLAFLFGLRALTCPNKYFFGSALTCALSAALALGTKVTAFVVIGGVAAVILVLAILLRTAPKRLFKLAVLGLVSFALVGSFQYVRNFMAFGNPFFSPVAEAEHSEIFRNENRDLVDNTVLTILQTGDMNGYTFDPESSIRKFQRAADVGIFDRLEINKQSQKNSYIILISGLSASTGMQVVTVFGGFWRLSSRHLF